MGTSIVAVHASCPLCGSPVLSIERSGRVIDGDLHAIQVGREAGRGYIVCDRCALLADLPTNLTLN